MSTTVHNKKRGNAKTRAVFLDRDGTINREVDNLKSISQLRVLVGSAPAIKRFNEMGFVVVIVTNQPVIGRGWINEKELDVIHAVLIKRLKKKNAVIDAIYYCPHHPEANLKKYRMICRCRKPNIGMILDAAKKYHITLKNSFIVGDSTRDILAGNHAGLKTILVKTGYGGRDGKHDIHPDFIAKDLLAAAAVIKKLEHHNAKK